MRMSIDWLVSFDPLTRRPRPPRARGAGGIETLVGLSLTESQLETYAFRTVLRAIGNSEPLRQRVLDAHSAKLRQVREPASE